MEGHRHQRVGVGQTLAVVLDDLRVGDHNSDRENQGSPNDSEHAVPYLATGDSTEGHRHGSHSDGSAPRTPMVRGEAVTATGRQSAPRGEM